MVRTTVISVRGRSHAELMEIEGFVYVGRRCRGWPDSIWGNPWRVGYRDLTAERAVELFKNYVTGDTPQGRSLRVRLPELRGKTLGCWCCDWPGFGEPLRPCHAVVLARLADSIEPS